jgi:hypothetical protein
VSGIAVVHLVRRQNGLAPLQRFLDSYRRYGAGAEHELIVLYKGFGKEVPADYSRALAGVSQQRMFLPDRGFDLQPYFAAVARFDHEYFCFLNSFSRILSADWLAKLRAPLSSRTAGLVGASGSCESLAALPAPKRWITQRFFAPFPNHHVRTNAFMTAREVLARVSLRPMLFKFLALACESGKDGLTTQVGRLGLDALVVDRNGTVYTKDRWHLSNTFRQSTQEDLLVSDNQTDAYASADAAGRVRLSRLAWGEWARPA